MYLWKNKILKNFLIKMEDEEDQYHESCCYINEKMDDIVDKYSRFEKIYSYKLYINNGCYSTRFLDEWKVNIIRNKNANPDEYDDLVQFLVENRDIMSFDEWLEFS